MNFRYEIILFYVCLIILGISATWYYFNPSSAETELVFNASSNSISSPYQINETASSSRLPPMWNEPARQSWDDEAIFEIFSPPKIYYNTIENTFVLEPPIKPIEHGDGFGIELVGFARFPYRLQYKGFAGVKGEYHILLGNEKSGEDLRVKVGDILSNEGVTILTFDVDRRISSDSNNAPLLRESIELQILDTRLGERITLGPEIRYSSQVGAILRTTGANPQAITLEPQQNFLTGEDIYTLHTVDIDEKSVVIKKDSIESEISEWRTLYLIDNDRYPDSAAAISAGVSTTKSFVQKDFSTSP